MARLTSNWLSAAIQGRPSRKRFGLVSSAILQWMRDGQKNNDVTYLKAVNEYHMQHEVGNFLGWCVKKIPDTREGHNGMEHRAIEREWIVNTTLIKHVLAMTLKLLIKHLRWFASKKKKEDN